MTSGLYEAKRPMTVLAGRYGHPLHPMLVTVPPAHGLPASCSTSPPGS
jgi:hypothetical protein